MLDSTTINSITSYINNLRALHNAQPFKYDLNIESVAQSYANILINNKFEHSGNLNYGENLYKESLQNKSPINLFKSSVDAWYNEEKIYDYSKNIFQPLSGHFSALVWKNSNSYGLGYASNNNFSVVVMNIYPAGNIVCQYTKNVQKK